MEEPDLRAYEPPPPEPYARWRTRFFVLVAILVLVPLVLVLYGLIRFGGDRAVVYDTPDDAEEDIVSRVRNKETVIGFGHPVYTIADPRNKIIKEVARKLWHRSPGSPG